NVDAAAGAVEETARLVAQIRRRWPRVRILLRGDSGFCRDALMAWCEANRVDYVFGLARNERLEQALVPEVITATIESLRTGRTARCFKDFRYATRDSWSRERRVIGKAEVTGGEANPRFIVTSLKRSEAAARQLYEHVYCARGDMENRIKECQLDLFADRTSTAAVVCLDGLRPALCVASYRPGTHAICRGDLRHHPVETAEVGRAGAGECAADQDRHSLRLSIAGCLRARPGAPAQRHRLTEPDSAQTPYRPANAAKTAVRAEHGRNLPGPIVYREGRMVFGLRTQSLPPGYSSV